jgi:Leucine-rich repeat (LRR) protein
VLVVSFNPLAAIPDEIEKLVNLRVLHAASCKLQDNQISIVSLTIDDRNFGQ